MGRDQFDRPDHARDSIEQLVLTAKFLGANPNPEVFAEGQMEYKCNYFLGNDPSKWHTDVPNYATITLKDIYPGIDLKYSGAGNGQVAYEFVTAPGVDLAQIKVAYEGAESTSLDSDGRMILKTKWGDMTAAIDSPRPLGEGSGVRAVLSGTASFAQLSENTPGLAASGQSLAQANSGTLALSYSTFLGGGSGDAGTDIAVDGSGNAYVTGVTGSSNFPTLNPYQTDLVGGDAFVTKLSSSGNSLIYSTYLGGDRWDFGKSIAVDTSGNVYLTGFTDSYNYPTSNPYQANQDTTDAFVTKLSSSGDSLIYSTYLGGGNIDCGNGIAVDGSGNAYVTGYTASSNFPTLNPYQSTYQGGSWGYDAFVTKLNGSGNSLIYSTYLGGESDDYGNGITVDDSGNAYLVGEAGPGFPTLNSLQTNQGGSDAFITKLASSGNSLIYSTFLGGAYADWGSGIAIDGDGNAYVTGGTSSLNFPTLNPFQTNQGGYGYFHSDAFVAKLASSGANLIYSTCLGGEGDDYGRGIAIDGNGNACVIGMTQSPNFPVLHPYQSYQGYGNNDVFVTKLSRLGNTLVYSTCLGGKGDDEGYGISVDISGNAYITGYTAWSDFPTLNPYQSTNHGGSDVFVTKLTWTPDYLCGDVDSDGSITIADVVFLIDYIFMGGAAPQTLSSSDVDCSGSINIADVVLMINYIFRAGPAPCTECG